MWKRTFLGTFTHPKLGLIYGRFQTTEASVPDRQETVSGGKPASLSPQDVSLWGHTGDPPGRNVVGPGASGELQWKTVSPSRLPHETLQMGQLVNGKPDFSAP